ncbi:MAG TPA: 1-(5-phosphoribosyl)-5-[(5-phosphoribosylamino)methylideneamino]imidazole-4-carboxamide isomerase [Woeseiaceae bacterium]|nr:1-(5-phosphoribosyl)-5-[(5-phosphoribosylamino)methylideneamino]imidazole-4-carboxamide isomerase [Woeseiaceae bacterium]
MIVIPAIDLRDGRCVRLLQGDFARETVWHDDPATLARDYRQAGFDHLHVVDLDGARDGRQRHEALVRAMVDEGGAVVQLGGGLRSQAAVERWLAAGVARCVVGSMAVEDPDAVAGWIEEFGPERIVVALDVRCAEGRDPVPAIRGWQSDAPVTLWECIDRYLASGLLHVLCTDVGRDGTLAGPNLDLYRELRRRYPALALQASGGVRDERDLAALEALGCAAAITGRALLEGTLDAREAACRRGA